MCSAPSTSASYLICGKAIWLRSTLRTFLVRWSPPFTTHHVPSKGAAIVIACYRALRDPDCRPRPPSTCDIKLVVRGEISKFELDAPPQHHHLTITSPAVGRSAGSIIIAGLRHALQRQDVCPANQVRLKPWDYRAEVDTMKTSP